MLLSSAISKFVRLGLLRELRPAFPWVSPRGATNVQGLPNRGPMVPRLAPEVSQRAPGTKSGYESAPAPRARPALSSTEMPVLLAPLTTLKGVPLWNVRSEEHTSELQSLRHLVCRLLLEKKKKKRKHKHKQNRKKSKTRGKPKNKTKQQYLHQTPQIDLR